MLGCSGSSTKNQNAITVFCASSLTDVMSEIAKAFEAETGEVVRFNFASSGTLARQIEHGAEPSLFISANKNWSDYLSKKNYTVEEDCIVGNSLVVVASKESDLVPFSFEEEMLSKLEGRLAIGDPRHVPAGEYAMQAFEGSNLVKDLQDNLLPAKDVRSALMVVELGEVALGIVYKTDALKSEKVKIVSEIPSELHDTIGYHAAILKGKNQSNVLLFYNFISSESAQKNWTKHGFLIE